MRRWFNTPSVIAAVLALAVAIASAIATPDSSLVPHLLGTVIAVTGVTIPLIILYRGDAPDIRQQVARRMEEYFATCGITPMAFKSACLSIHSNPPSAGGKIVFMLEALYRAREKKDAKGEYEHFDAETLTWLFGAGDKHKMWFEFLLDTGGDQPISLRYLYLLVALGLSNFVILYLMFVRAPIPSGIYEWFLSDTFFMNVAVYIVLGTFASERARLNKIIDESVMRYCPEIVDTIKSAVARNSAIRPATLEDDFSDDDPASNGAPKSRRQRRRSRNKEGD